MVIAIEGPKLNDSKSRAIIYLLMQNHMWVLKSGE